MGLHLSVNGGHFDNDEYIYKATARRMINIHKQTDTIAVLLATVGLARAHPKSLWQSLSAAALLLESLLCTCTSTIKSPLVLAIEVKMPHVGRLLSGKQMV